MEKKNISRRSFLKLFGAGTVGAAATLAGCKQANKAEEQAANEYKNQVEPPVGKMTYRENPKTKEKVSILGYGMMRLPTKVDNSDEYDQDMINKQVDYAIEHGISRSIVLVSPSVAISAVSISWQRNSRTSIATTGLQIRQRKCTTTR